MEEATRRRKELMTWAYAAPRLIRRIDDVRCLPNVTASQALEVESISERIGILLRAIHEVVEADESDERLTASMDCLREKVTSADATLNRLLRPGSVKG
jgi:hypothetical protein